MQWGILALLIVWAVPGFGVDKEGIFLVLGNGNASCGGYVSVFEKDRRERPSASKITDKLNGYSQWVAGYLTAYNAWKFEGQDVTHGTDRQGWERWIYNWCVERPTEALAYAVGAFVLSHNPDPFIKRVQEMLTDLGYDPGPADGFSGRRTRAAIRKFQQDKGLGVDGKVTDALFDMIAREYYQRR